MFGIRQIMKRSLLVQKGGLQRKTLPPLRSKVLNSRPLTSSGTIRSLPFVIFATQDRALSISTEFLKIM